jgi:hypothetical protein
MSMTDQDKDLCIKARDLRELGVRVEVDKRNDVWACASLRLNRGIEYLGRCTDARAFLERLDQLTTLGSYV